MTDGNSINMGLPLRANLRFDLIRTPQLLVLEEVDFELKLLHAMVIEVHFREKGAENRAKPDGYDGAVFVWDILDPSGRGKTVYISAAWQNE